MRTNATVVEGTKPCYYQNELVMQRGIILFLGPLLSPDKNVRDMTYSLRANLTRNLSGK